MAWLDDHPPRTQQFRCPRRERPSGIIGVHTAESFPDEVGPDTGAENVADFIRRRTNYGSYHLLADSDSIIQLVRFECVAYHIATHGLNEHTIGISAATQAAKWNSLGDDWVDATVRNMARAAARAARWLQREYGITVPARRITLAQALDGERGFLAHGDADPDRRTDPGATFPWQQFLDDYAAIMAGEEDDVTPQEMRQELVRFFGQPVGDYLDGKPMSRDEALHRSARFSGSNTNRLRYNVLPELAAIRAAAADDPAAIAAELAPLVIPPVVAAVGAAGGLTAEQVEEAAEKALRDVLREGVDA